MSRGTAITIRATTAISTRTTTPKRRSDADVLPRAHGAPGTPGRAALRLLAAFVAAPLLVFAHRYTLTLYPIVAACGAAALIARPAILRRGTRWLDASILAALAGIALQLVPLAPATRVSIAPASVGFDRQMLLGAQAVVGARPISVNPPATALALAIASAMALAFWTTRAALRSGGIRFLARTVAATALAASPIAVLHHLGVLSSLDAIWPLARPDLRAWGPFVSRNDFAGWLLLALGLTLGYAITRVQARLGPWAPLDPERAFDETGTWLAVSIALSAGGVMLSLSRSGLLGVAVGLTLFLLLGRSRLTTRRLTALAIALGILMAAAALLANVGALSTRLQTAVSEGFGGRWSIWRQTWPIVRDFWPVGAGVGAYARVMTLYQTSIRLITIAHADSEPLQILAEGGALVGVPIALALASFVALAIRRLREDRTPIFWLRAGAIAGLAGIAAQNLVEMTLRVPAIGLLFVMAAGVAVHDPAPPVR